MREKHYIYAFILVLIIFLPLCVHGKVIKTSLKARVSRSDLIITGEIKDIKTSWNEKRSHIWTYVTVSVDEHIKGTTFSKEVVVKIPGGTIKEEDISQWIEDTPIFNKKEKVLLMLKTLPDLQHYAVVNSKYGKFSITKDNKISGKGIKKSDLIRQIREHMRY